MKTTKRLFWLGVFAVLVAAGCQGVTSEKRANEKRVYSELEGAYHDLGLARTDATEATALEQWNELWRHAEAELAPEQLAGLVKKFARKHPEGSRTRPAPTSMTGGVAGKRVDAAEGGFCYGEYVPSDQIPLVRVKCCEDHRMMGTVLGTPWQCGAGVRCPGCPDSSGGE